MSNQTSQNSPLKVAAPYYGSLDHPGGQGNIFLVMDVDPVANRVARLDVKVWNPKDGCRLGNWLQQFGIKTFFCRNIESCHQQDLHSSGIHIESLGCRDIVAGVKHRLAATGTHLFTQAGQVPA